MLQLEIGADGKVAKKIQEKLKAIYPAASYFLASLDDDAERSGLYPMVSADHLRDYKSKGFNAKAWVEAVSQRLAPVREAQA